MRAGGGQRTEEGPAEQVQGEEAGLAGERRHLRLRHHVVQVLRQKLGVAHGAGGAPEGGGRGGRDHGHVSGLEDVAQNGQGLHARRLQVHLVLPLGLSPEGAEQGGRDEAGGDVVVDAERHGVEGHGAVGDGVLPVELHVAVNDAAVVLSQPAGHLLHDGGVGADGREGDVAEHLHAVVGVNVHADVLHHEVGDVVQVEGQVDASGADADGGLDVELVQQGGELVDVAESAGRGLLHDDGADGGLHVEHLLDLEVLHGGYDLIVKVVLEGPVVLGGAAEDGVEGHGVLDVALELGDGALGARSPVGARRPQAEGELQDGADALLRVDADVLGLLHEPNEVADDEGRLGSAVPVAGGVRDLQQALGEGAVEHGVAGAVLEDDSAGCHGALVAAVGDGCVDSGFRDELTRLHEGEGRKRLVKLADAVGGELRGVGVLANHPEAGGEHARVRDELQKGEQLDDGLVAQVRQEVHQLLEKGRAVLGGLLVVVAEVAQQHVVHDAAALGEAAAGVVYGLDEHDAVLGDALRGVGGDVLGGGKGLLEGLQEAVHVLPGEGAESEGEQAGDHLGGRAGHGAHQVHHVVLQNVGDVAGGEGAGVEDVELADEEDLDVQVGLVHEDLGKGAGGGAPGLHGGRLQAADDVGALHADRVVRAVLHQHEQDAHHQGAGLLGDGAELGEGPDHGAVQAGRVGEQRALHVQQVLDRQGGLADAEEVEGLDADGGVAGAEQQALRLGDGREHALGAEPLGDFRQADQRVAMDVRHRVRQVLHDRRHHRAHDAPVAQLGDHAQRGAAHELVRRGQVVAQGVANQDALLDQRAVGLAEIKHLNEQMDQLLQAVVVARQHVADDVHQERGHIVALEQVCGDIRANGVQHLHQIACSRAATFLEALASSSCVRRPAMVFSGVSPRAR
ncbi:uncharacterized protein BcabD6B2_21790 [Babesia caballi]|uniref:Uncharacterized protein n=1 Tax=Babesia caballi TaxID=5871 RepID=A0AAV4LW29_BABCB|nr:hypothetical protein BcabD6B2_21790 [Babesia caballi]